MIIKMLLAFLASIFFGIMLQIPKKTILPVGLVGMLGWTSNYLLIYYGSSDILGAFAGALVVSVIAEFLARFQRMPVTVYVVAGIIPLVPGVIAYRAMLNFIEGKYAEGLSSSALGVFMAAAIALGVALISLAAKNYKENKSQNRQKKEMG